MSSKILWGEGLFLRPQHFQQQDRYHEQRLHQSVLALHPYAWGVNQLQVDRDALLQMGSALSRCLQDLAAIETTDQPTDDLLEVAYAAVERWMNQCAACVQRLKTTEPPCNSR